MELIQNERHKPWYITEGAYKRIKYLHKYRFIVPLKFNEEKYPCDNCKIINKCESNPSKYGHNYIVCSDICGHELAGKLEILEMIKD